MSQRMDYRRAAPDGMKAFASVHSYVHDCGLPPALIELVYLRVSQINGCAYCLDMHSRELMKVGVAIEKLVLVQVWREAASMFSAQEQAALAWAESVTKIAETGAPDADYAAAAAVFSERELADLTITISLMNAYNRLAISFRAVPSAARRKS